MAPTGAKAKDEEKDAPAESPRAATYHEGGDVETMTVEDQYGTEVTVEVGVDGSSPISPNNPSAKAVLGPTPEAEAEAAAAAEAEDEDASKK